MFHQKLINFNQVLNKILIVNETVWHSQTETLTISRMHRKGLKHEMFYDFAVVP